MTSRVVKDKSQFYFQDAGNFLDLSVITGDGERDDGHLIVMAAIFPVIAAVKETVDSIILPDWMSNDYINLLALLYGGPTR